MSFDETMIVVIVSTFLTLIANLVFYLLKDYYEWFGKTEEFKRKHRYEQLTNLYLDIYSIVVQSEYLRYFHKLEEDIKDIPFIETSTKRRTITHNIYGDIKEKKEISLVDAVSEFNKTNMISKIINNSKYASQDILKLAVAHRYVNRHYTDESIEKDLLNKFQIEEVNLINNIVKTIIKETNMYLKTCNIDFNKEELKNGTFDNSAYRDNAS